MPASAPVRPTAFTPAAHSAATNAVLMRPASTDTTVSSVSASVTRRPSANTGALPRAFRSASIARPPPWTTATGPEDWSAAMPAAAARIAAASSRSSPPSLRSVILTAAQLLAWFARGARSLQPQPFVEAEGDVEVLHRLSGRPLHEVVDADDEHELPPGLVDAPADVTEVRVR